MTQPDFKVSEIKPGTPNIQFIEQMTTTQFVAWIRARLSGDDHYYPLHESGDEERDLVFIWIFRNSSDSAFITNFCVALCTLLKTESTSSDEFTEKRKEFLFHLITLSGYFLSHYKKKGFPDGCNESRSEIEAALRKLCNPEGPLPGLAYNGRDIYLRALFVLRESESEFKDAFWRGVFAMKDGIYAAPAFGAFARRAPDLAIDLIPDFLSAHSRHPKLVPVDYELHLFYRDNPQLREPENQKKIIRLLNKDKNLLTIFYNETNRYDIHPFDNEILRSEEIRMRVLQCYVPENRVGVILCKTPYNNGIFGKRDFACAH